MNKLYTLLILTLISCSNAKQLRGDRGRDGGGRKEGLDKVRDSFTSDGIQPDDPHFLSNEAVDIKGLMTANLEASSDNSTSTGKQARIVGGYRSGPQSSYVMFLVNQGAKVKSVGNPCHTVC